jgi:hypothetical protein
MQWDFLIEISVAGFSFLKRPQKTELKVHVGRAIIIHHFSLKNYTGLSSSCLWAESVHLWVFVEGTG